MGTDQTEGENQGAKDPQNTCLDNGLTAWRAQETKELFAPNTAIIIEVFVLSAWYHPQLNL